MLKEYMTWVEANYDVDEVNEKLTDKRTGNEFAPVRSTTMTTPKKRISKLAQASKEWAKHGECQPECDPSTLTRQGSNIYQTKVTCLKCGKVTVTKNDQQPPRRVEAVCPHDRVDFKGSTKTTHRVRCKDCHAIVFAQPQDEYNMQQEMAV